MVNMSDIIHMLSATRTPTQIPNRHLDEVSKMDLMKEYSELLQIHESMRKELEETREQLAKLLVRHTLNHRVTPHVLMRRSMRIERGTKVVGGVDFEAPRYYWRAGPSQARARAGQDPAGRN
jgi:hypothetical protein